MRDPCQWHIFICSQNSQTTNTILCLTERRTCPVRHLLCKNDHHEMSQNFSWKESLCRSYTIKALTCMASFSTQPFIYLTRARMNFSMSLISPVLTEHSANDTLN